MVLIEITRVIQEKIIDDFRPLAGIMVLIEQHLIAFYKPQEWISVPLRGLWFLSAK